MSIFEQIDDETFVYKPENYPGPIVINCEPSKELKEYHKNSYIQINISKELLKKLLEIKEKENE